MKRHGMDRHGQARLECALAAGVRRAGRRGRRRRAGGRRTRRAGRDALGGRVVAGQDAPEDGVDPLRRVAGAEAPQRVLQQVRHRHRAQLLLHRRRRAGSSPAAARRAAAIGAELA